jgi:transcriptional regulator with XRE-family HTH domain
MGVTNAAVSWWETKGAPRYQTIIKLARLLGEDPEEFLDAHYEDMYDWATKEHPEKHFCRLSLSMRGYPGLDSSDTCETFYTRVTGRGTDFTQEEQS